MPPKLENIAEKISEKLGLCGFGKEGNWSVRVADYFFVDCGCCWFWRGFCVGFGTLMIIVAILFLLLKVI